MSEEKIVGRIAFEPKTECERASMAALGASLDQTDNVLKEFVEAEAQLASLKALVREMGEVLQRVSLDSQAQELLNRIDAKRIMEGE